MQKSNTRVLFTILTAFALLVAACGSDESDTTAAEEDATVEPEGSITIYSGRGEDLVGPLVDQFVAETGIDAEVRYGSSAEMLALIQEEGDSSPADVFYSQGAGFLGVLSAADGLAPLEDSTTGLVLETLQSPAGDWVGTSGRARVVAYNTDMIAEDDLPESILSFTDPAWSGRLGYAPTNASFQDFVTALRAIEGEDAAKEWLEGIIANGAVPYEGNSPLMEGIAAGEVEVGFTNHYYLYRFLAEDADFPVANKFYTDGDAGALINIAGAGVLASSDNQAGAEAFIAYMLSETGQQYFVEETSEIPLIDGVDAPPAIPALDSLTLPAFDLNLLLDLQGTIDLLTEVGAL